MPLADICDENGVEKVPQCLTVDPHSRAKVCEEIRGPNAVVESCHRSGERHGTQMGVL